MPVHRVGPDIDLRQSELPRRTGVGGLFILASSNYTVYAVGISQAQAFVGGNKRTAFIAADVVLRANGCLFTGEPLEMARQLEAVATREGSEEEATARFAEWLRRVVSYR